MPRKKSNKPRQKKQSANSLADLKSKTKRLQRYHEQEAKRAAREIADIERLEIIEARRAELKTRTLGAQAVKRDREYQRRQSEIDKRLKLSAKERKAYVKGQMETLRDLGLYNPKSTRLTKARIKTVEKLSDSYRDLFNPDKFFAKPIPKSVAKSKPKLKKFVGRAKQAGFVANDKIVFVPRKGDKSAKWEYDRDLKAWSIVTTRKYRSKKTGRVATETNRTPIVGVDELILQSDILRKRANRIKLKSNEFLTFKIGGNLSRTAFKTIDKLIAYARKYESITAKQVEFLSSITMSKMTLSEFTRTRSAIDNDRRAKPRKMTRAQRRKFGGRGPK